jgi:acetylornithine deacetylase/succinyl-diaminopimelate desuccinylase-like protein
MDPTLIEQILNLAVSIQQIPAPTFNEARRAAFVYDRFRLEGLLDVTRDEAGNVYARLPGEGSARPLVVSAHLDTVFPEETALTISRSPHKIAGAGIGDNALGVAGLFYLVWALRSPQTGLTRLPGDLWLVANTGEEGLGDLAGMRCVVDRLGAQVRAYLILEGMALGQVYHRGLGVRRYRIDANVAGGHSWVDFGQPSAVHELAGVINRLVAIPLPKEPRTSLNVGVFSGGTSVNTIAAHAYCLLDLRSEDGETLQSLASEVEAVVQAANSPGMIEMSAVLVGQRPVGALPVTHPLVRLAVRCMEAHGVQPYPNIGSTDANLPLSRGLPAICLGLTTGGGAHTTAEFIDTRPLAKGLAQLLDFVRLVYS